jgi:hypothetical protein
MIPSQVRNLKKLGYFGHSQLPYRKGIPKEQMEAVGENQTNLWIKSHCAKVHDWIVE